MSVDWNVVLIILLGKNLLLVVSLFASPPSWKDLFTDRAYSLAAVKLLC